MKWHHEQQPEELWIAEAGAYKGLRRTGVPLLPENRMPEFNENAGSACRLQQATKTAAEHSYTNKIVWEEAKKRDPLPLFWNAVMGHPHREGQPFSNRTPTSEETDAFSVLIPMLTDLYNIEKIICIGRKSEASVEGLNLGCKYVRHPANGGVKKFRRQIRTRL